MSRPRLTPFEFSGLGPRRRRGSEAGFALLITITLLAFLVLLLVSLATLTRVETQVAANTRQLSGARQNALMALTVALGRLQAEVGPDQRVTGTADVVSGRHLDKKNWTGVWDTDPDPVKAMYGQHRAWLVSGAAAAGDAAAKAALSAASGNELVPLVSSGSTDISTPGTGNLVRVESQAIKSDKVPGLADNTMSPYTIGAFAYWVGDEGVKAKVSLVDPWTGSGVAAERRYSFITAQRSGIERVEGAAGAALGTNYPANQASLARLLSLDQLPFIGGDQASLATARLNRFHDLTARSFSVLADAAQGGLKKDLTNWLNHAAPASAVEQDSAPLISSAEGTAYGMPKWGMLRSYAALTDDGGAAVAPQVQTDAQHGIYPVITYFRLGVAVSCDGEGQPLKIHLFPTLVLWNPHSVPLAHIDPATGNPVRYEVAFAMRGASSRLRFRVGDASGTEKAYLAWNKANLGGGGAANQYFRFEVTPTGPIPPGQSLVFTLGNDGDYVPGQNAMVNAADSGSSAVMLGSTLSASDLAAGIYWDKDSSPGNTMDVVLRSKPVVTDPAPVDYALLPGAYHTVQKVGYGSPSMPGVTKPPALTTPPLAPQLHFRLYATMSTSSGIHAFRWIAQQNYRASFSPRPDIDGSAYHSIYYGASNINPANLNFAEGGARASAGIGVQSSTATDLVLAEVRPQGVPLFSLAQLQHVNFSQISHYPTYPLGNSLADPHIDLDKTEVTLSGGNAGGYGKFYDIAYLLNRQLWDRYFFSTVPAAFDAASLADAGYQLPNARHVVRRDPLPSAASSLNGAGAFDTAAANLLLSGGFNVNSTSEQAWRALLASHLGQAVDPADTAMRHPFSRYANPPAGDPNKAWTGYRILSDRQIERLATLIVAEVKARGPFLSLADFVNRRLIIRGADTTDAQRYKGALQAAIDAADVETGANAAPINADAVFKANLVPSTVSSGTYNQKQFQGGESLSAPYSSRSAFAPGYLTQADLLTALGPVLTARSDTFVIRAYGDVRNPVTDATEGKAWCEAWVQRMPEYVGNATPAWETPAAGSVAATFGRRFQVVSFRWLTQNDI